jgi:hypothetical protein
METWKQGDMRHGNMETWTWRNGHRDMHMDPETWNLKESNGKRKPRRFSLIRLPFAYRANGSSSFDCFLTKKQTEVIRLQAD